MPEVIFTQQAYTDLYLFIVHYKDSFVDLYSDSGIWSENEIIENYRKNAEGLYARIYETIMAKLSSRQVLGRIAVGKSSQLNFYVGSRLIMVIFSEGKEDNARWVESIFINRKPIIF